MDISIIIVNYNVREFMRGALESVRRSLVAGGLSGEVFVVDNASRDGSVEMLRSDFPEVKLIALDHNAGFGKANNLALKAASGDYLLILNPDTIVGEDTLRIMVDFMQSHPDAGLSGCKLLNADGSFQVSCRRGFPTPWASFSKLFGLSSAFPNSPLFAQYNLTYLPVGETYEIDALAGAFMLLSKKAFEVTNGFDEDFFMYGEDIDLSYRVKKSGFGVWYVHSTSTVHFKGESTRRSALNEIKVFYEAMDIFVRKHYGTSPVFTTLLRVGIMARSFAALLRKHRGAIVLAIGDAMISAIAVVLATKVLFGSWFSLPSQDYPWAFIAPSIIVLSVHILLGAYNQGERRRSKQVILGMPAILIILSSITYFFKEIPSSRSLVLVVVGFASVGMIFERIAFQFLDRLRFGGEGSASPELRKTLLVGTANESQRIAGLLQSTGFTRRYKLVGFISRTITDIGKEILGSVRVMGDLTMLPKLIRDERITQVIFPADEFSYSEMLTAMQAVNAEELTHEVSFNVVPQASDVLLSRSKIELIKPVDSPQGLALMEMEYNLLKPSHRFSKRVLDIAGAIVLFPVLWVGSIISKNIKRKGLLGNIKSVLSGERSFVGIKASGSTAPISKIGLISLSDVTVGPVSGVLRSEDIEQMNLYYAQHHSIGMDIEILFKKLLSNKTPH